MIYLLQDNMVEQLELRNVYPKSVQSIIELVDKKDGALSFSDSDYKRITGFFDYLDYEFRVVIDAPGVSLYPSVLAEGRADVLITLKDYLSDSNLVGSNEVARISDDIKNIARGDLEDE